METPKPPHLAGGHATQPLHLVVLGLTVPYPQAYRLWVARLNRERPTRSAAGTIRRSRSGPQDRLGSTDDTTMRQLQPKALAKLSRRESDGGTGRNGSRDRQHRPGHGTGNQGDAPTRRPAAATTDATHGRHAGPWGASFDGTEPDGKTPVKGLTFERRWTRPDVHPYDEITWEYRTAGIANESGKTVFEQKDVEVPDFWSQLATNVVVSKYFRGHLGTPGARDQRQAAHRPRRQHDRRLGGDPALLRDRRGPRRPSRPS